MKKIFCLAVAMTAMASVADVVTNVVVSPLTDSHWTQGTPYNDYSPKGTTAYTSGWEAGCVAIAAAQELYRWQWPWSLGAVRETSHPVMNESNLALRFDGNVPFDWANMPDSFSSGETLAQKHAVAHLVLACQSLVQMQFVNAGGEAKKNLPGTMEWFEFDRQVDPKSGDEAIAALRSDFEFGSPVQTGINFKGYGGHEVVGLGFATTSGDEEKDLIWLNLGWGGGSDGWYDIAEATEGETIIKSVQLGFRPIKSVQVEPVAPVSGSSVTLNWHLPNCYTNKISGFTVANKKLGSATTTWSDDFSTAKGRSSNTNEVRIVNGALKAWDGTASGMYIWDEVLVPTADSVLTYDVGSSYMSGMSVRFEAKVDGAWQTIHTVAVNGGNDGNYYNWGTTTPADPVSLASLAGKPIQLRYVVEYTNGGIYTSDDASVKIDNLAISGVKTFAEVSSETISDVAARTKTFTGLESGETYAFAVTPVMSDSSAAVTQTVTTTIGTPAPSPVIGAVTMSPKGSDLMQDGFYTDIAMGWNIIDVACSESVTLLEAFPSHQSVLPQSKVQVVDNGGGSFSINIDATEVAAKWAGQRMILTLKATNSTGETVYKDLELRLDSSLVENVPSGKTRTFAAGTEGEVVAQNRATIVLVLSDEQVAFGYTTSTITLNYGATLRFENEDGDEIASSGDTVEGNAKVWMGNSALWIGTTDYTDNWAYGEQPEDGDYAKFVTQDEFGAEMNLNLSAATELGYVNVTGLGQLKISGTSSETLTIDTLKNDVQVEVNSTKLKIKKAVPSANIVIDSGSSLDCEIDQSRYGYIKKVNNGYVSALTDSALWKGTVVFDNYTAAGQNLSDYGNTSSKVRLSGVSGWLANNTTFNPTIELVDDGSTPALNWNNGSTGAKETIKALTGTGTFKTSGSGGAAERVVINNIDDFAGSFDLSLKRIVIGDSDPTTSNNGSITVNSGKSVTIAAGKTWKVTGGFFFKGNQTITVNGTLNGAITAEGTGTTLALKPTSAVTAASLNMANNTISIEKSASAASAVTVSGEATLTGATIVVNLTDEATDSIALITANSFSGLDSVTLTGLDGYALEVEDGVLYAKSLNPSYDGPEPIAVWVAGEFDDDRSAHGGLEFALNDNTIDENGNIVIGSSTTLGATVAIPEGHSKASVLVKYSIPDGAHVNDSVLASMFSAYDLGALSDSGESTTKGYWFNGSAVKDGSYAFGSSAPSIPQEGYLLLSYKHDSYTAAYLGETISTLAGGSNGSLHFSNNDVTKMAFGGPTVEGAKPWAGMVIKSVAIFLDEYLSNTDLANYTFPVQGAVQPVDSDRYVVEPVVSWVNDFKTTEKGDYTLSVSGTTAAKDDTFGGTLTIGDAAAIIDTTAASSTKMTVLIKYRAASNVTNAPVVAFGGMAAVGLDVGVYTKSDKTLAVYRNYSTDNTKPYDFGTAPLLSATGGYVLCARDNGQQCMAYVGDSLDAMTGGTVSDGGIKFSNITLTKLGIGGNSGMAANANDMVPFAGLEIEKIVVFNGYYTPDQVRYIPNPEDGDTVNISDNTTWTFTASDTPRNYTSIGTLSSSGTIAIANASELTEGTYPLATWTTPQQYTTECAGYGKVGTLVTEGLATGLSARLIYGARGIYLRVDDTAKQAARKPLVVWCYGDSITEGYNAQATGANYRILLYQKLEMLGYNVRSTGVYGLSNNHDSVDPSGTPLTDQYKWHSAKHGATAGPTTLAHRSNLSENVDTLAIQAGTPDVALLLIGVNDIPEWKNEADRVTPVFKAWTNVVSRMVKNLPDTKIVVSTILYSDGTRTDIDPTITAINTQIKNLFGNLPEAWQGHVVLADLNSIVKSGQPGIIYSDHLHPDWWGYDQMADGYLEKIVECYPDPDATNFPSQNPIPDAPTENELGAANKTELADYRAGFKKLCNIRVEKGQDVSNIQYDNMNSEAVSENIGKVGYFVEFVRDDNHAHKWVWVDMDAFGDKDLASVGLPQCNYQQAVTKMHVCSNHGAIDNVAADDDSVTGWIEFSPYNYSNPQSNASAPENYGNPFDWNDTLSTSGSYGCMQVFRVMNPSSKNLFERPQLMFAFNNFRSQNSNPADFGIGNFAQHFNCNNSYHTEDWTGVGGTLAKMAPDQYSVKTIEIWTKASEPEEPVRTDVHYKSGFWGEGGENPFVVVLDNDKPTTVLEGETVIIDDKSSGVDTIYFGSTLPVNANKIKVSRDVIFSSGANNPLMLDGATITVDDGVTLTFKRQWNNMALGDVVINGPGTVKFDQNDGTITIGGALSGSATMTVETGKQIAVAADGSIANTIAGDGTVAYASMPSVPMPLAAGWTGTVELPQFTASGQMLTDYCNNNSKLKLNGINGGYLHWTSFTLNAELILAGDFVLTDMSQRDFGFTKISGSGNISLSPGGYELTSFTIDELAEGFSGAVSNNMNATKIVITNLMLPANTPVTPGSKVLAMGGSLDDGVKVTNVKIGGVLQNVQLERRNKDEDGDGLYVKVQIDNQGTGADQVITVITEPEQEAVEVPVASGFAGTIVVAPTVKSIDTDTSIVSAEQVKVKYGDNDITGAFNISDSLEIALNADGSVEDVAVKPALDEESSIEDGSFTVKTIPGLWYGVKYGDALEGGDIGGTVGNTTPEQATDFGDRELFAPKDGACKFYRVRVGARRSDIE